MGIWRRIVSTNGGDSLAGDLVAPAIQAQAASHVVSTLAVADQAEVFATVPGAVLDFAAEPPIDRFSGDFGLRDFTFVGQHMPPLGRQGWPVRTASYDEPHHFSLIGLFPQSFDHDFGF